MECRVECRVGDGEGDAGGGCGDGGGGGECRVECRVGDGEGDCGGGCGGGGEGGEVSKGSGTRPCENYRESFRKRMTYSRRGGASCPSTPAGRAFLNSRRFFKGIPVNRKEFGGRVRALRKKLRMTQVQLAGRAGIAQRFISKIERGEMNFSIDYISRIGRAMKKEIEVQFKNADKNPKNKKK